MNCNQPDCSADAQAKGLCWKHYKRFQRHGDPAVVKRLPARVIFDSMVRADGECLVWRNPDSKGYGRITDDFGRYVPAHRYAWEQANGEIPDGLQVDHICRNPACVKVAHLRLATPGQNMDNMSPYSDKSGTGYRGVRKTSGSTWEARVIHRGELIQMCGFKSPEEAALARAEKRLELKTYNDADRTFVQKLRGEIR